jgi:hypothetical protein
MRTAASGTRCLGMSTRRGYLLRAISWIDTISGLARMYRPDAAGFSAALMCASAASRTSTKVKLKPGAP